MIIHILAGSKGGIGKTRCGVSIAMYYLLGGSGKPFLEKSLHENPNKQRINIFDANVNNIDFFTIMTRKDIEILSSYKKFHGGSKKDFVKQEFGKIVHERRTLPNNGYAYIRMSPFELFNGISDFWSSILDVAKVSKENDGAEVLIVDTNLAIPNLVSDDPVQRAKMKSVFQKFRKIDIHHLVIWYIWSLNDFLSIRENSTFNTAKKIDSLERICQVNSEIGEKGNNINQYVIHVLNPYLFFEKTPGFRAFLKKLLSNRAFKEIIQNIKIGFNLPFEIAVKILVEIITEIVNDDSTDSSATFEKTLEQIREINSTGINIVVLKDQKENYSYIKDQLISISSNKSISLETMHKKNFGEDSLWKKLDEFHRWI